MKERNFWPVPEYLQQFFIGNEYDHTPVILYDKGTKAPPEFLTYAELTCVSRYFSNLVNEIMGMTCGFIAVACPQTHTFPAILLG